MISYNELEKITDSEELKFMMLAAKDDDFEFPFPLEQPASIETINKKDRTIDAILFFIFFLLSTTYENLCIKIYTE